MSLSTEKYAGDSCIWPRGFDDGPALNDVELPFVQIELQPALDQAWSAFRVVEIAFMSTRAHPEHRPKAFLASASARA